MVTPSFRKLLVQVGLAKILIEVAKFALFWFSGPILAALTVFAGYLQNIPWVFIIPAATLVFAATVTGLLRADELADRRSPSNKLRYVRMYLRADFKRNQNGKVTEIERVQVVVVLKSFAAFPIVYSVEEINTSFAGRINPAPVYDSRGTTVEAHGEKEFRDATIDTPGLQIGKLPGALRFVIKYGHPGREKYRITHNERFEVEWDDARQSFGLVTHTDVVQ